MSNSYPGLDSGIDSRKLSRLRRLPLCCEPGICRRGWKSHGILMITAKSQVCKADRLSTCTCTCTSGPLFWDPGGSCLKYLPKRCGGENTAFAPVLIRTGKTNHRQGLFQGWQRPFCLFIRCGLGSEDRAELEELLEIGE